MLSALVLHLCVFVSWEKPPKVQIYCDFDWKPKYEKSSFTTKGFYFSILVFGWGSIQKIPQKLDFLTKKWGSIQEKTQKQNFWKRVRLYSRVGPGCIRADMVVYIKNNFEFIKLAIKYFRCQMSLVPTNIVNIFNQNNLYYSTYLNVACLLFI